MDHYVVAELSRVAIALFVMIGGIYQYKNHQAIKQIEINVNSNWSKMVARLDAATETILKVTSESAAKTATAVEKEKHEGD
jgi:hypothetical protein